MVKTSRKTSHSPAATLRATTASYDAANHRVLVELTGGVLFGIPLARLPEIAHASPRQLDAVEVVGAGNVLHWEALDADYSVPALALSMIPRAAAAKELARLAGSATSRAKATAARTNGKKGGRPRKTTASKRVA